MNWTAQQKIIFGFWLLTVIAITLGALTFFNTRHLIAAVNHVETRNETLKRVENLLSELKDVEVAQREYILLGREESLERIRRLRKEIDGDVHKLNAMSGPEKMWLAHLQSLIPEKFQEIEKTVELQHELGPEAAASQALLTDRGHQAMDDIRRVISNIMTQENERLEVQRKDQRHRIDVTVQLVGGVLLLNLSLIWTLFFLQRRETRTVQQINEELERRVALRTEALQRSNEDLQQFAYVASHDLKEPLRMISSYSTLLQRRYSGRLDADADLFLNFITDGARRMNTLIQDLLEYSRAGLGKEDEVAPVDVNKVLKNVTTNLKVSIAESGASIITEGLPESVLYDEMRLTQIFQNLIGNAIKYRDNRRPLVRIRAEANSDETVFSVSDNGIGIQPEYIDSIFGIFQRLHGKEYEGTGIGLAMVKKIVERHGGRIWVESTPGAGSTFYFTVLHSAPAGLAEASASTST